MEYLHNVIQMASLAVVEYKCNIETLLKMRAEVIGIDSCGSDVEVITAVVSSVDASLQ